MVYPRDARANWVAEATAAFRVHAPRLHRSLLGRLRNEQDTLDAVQEVFLRLMRVPDGDLVADPVKYLFGIARHVVSEIVARRTRELVDFNSDLTDDRTEHPQDHPTDRLAHGVETEQALAQALKRLRPVEREILILTKCEGMTREEVAQALGLSAHTVKKYATQAMAQLRMDWVSIQLGGRKL